MENKYYAKNIRKNSFNGFIYTDNFGDQYFSRDIYGNKYK